ncbi:unnamed protein product [Penicillium nalgiovense]|nr:unnamed protein product [Penicillium nalgiovense]
MNPTVEDEVDCSHNSKATPKGNPNANDTVPWSEVCLRKARTENKDGLRRTVTDRLFLYNQIFSRHEAVLCSHLEMLSMVKEQIAPEVNGFQTVSSMVNKTVLAMNQLKIARKHMMSRNATPPTSSSRSSSNPTQSTDTEANTRKKRRRISQDNDKARSDPPYEKRASKRHRDSSPQPATEQDGQFTSTSLGTEDISAEVQRRLKIKEEQRLKKENPKADKRKRESLASNEGETPIPSRPRKKRLRLENGHKRDGDPVDNEADSPKKKQRKTP